MTTGAFIFVLGFGFAVGLFALLTFHLKDNSANKTRNKPQQMVNQ